MPVDVEGNVVVGFVGVVSSVVPSVLVVVKSEDEDEIVVVVRVEIVVESEEVNIRVVDLVVVFEKG